MGEVGERQGSATAILIGEKGVALHRVSGPLRGSGMPHRRGELTLSEGAEIRGTALYLLDPISLTLPPMPSMPGVVLAETVEGASPRIEDVEEAVGLWRIESAICFGQEAGHVSLAGNMSHRETAATLTVETIEGLIIGTMRDVCTAEIGRWTATGHHLHQVRDQATQACGRRLGLPMPGLAEVPRLGTLLHRHQLTRITMSGQA